MQGPRAAARGFLVTSGRLLLAAGAGFSLAASLVPGAGLVAVLTSLAAPHGVRNLPGSGIELVSLCLAGRFLITAPPEKPEEIVVCFFFLTVSRKLATHWGRRWEVPGGAEARRGHCGQEPVVSVGRQKKQGKQALDWQADLGAE